MPWDQIGHLNRAGYGGGSWLGGVGGSGGGVGRSARLTCNTSPNTPPYANFLVVSYYSAIVGGRYIVRGGIEGLVSCGEWYYGDGSGGAAHVCHHQYQKFRESWLLYPVGG